MGLFDEAIELYDRHLIAVDFCQIHFPNPSRVLACLLSCPFTFQPMLGESAAQHDEETVTCSSGPHTRDTLSPSCRDSGRLSR